MQFSLFEGQGEEIKRAVISRCGKYRYYLERSWDFRKPLALFVGLNPSTADAEVDDPTVRRCRGFTKIWGCGGFAMVNLFAYRATNPNELKKVEDPIGPENNDWLVRVAWRCFPAVAAWGAYKGAREREKEVVDLLLSMGLGGRISCLGRSKDGFPCHPLYLPKNTTLESFL